MRGVVRKARASLRGHAYSLASIGLLPPSALASRRGGGVLRHGRVLYALVGLIALLAVAALRFEAPSHGLVAVVFPPWVDAEEARERVRRSGGVVVGEPESGGVVLAISADWRFTHALRREGAVLILDGAAFRDAEQRLEDPF